MNKIILKQKQEEKKKQKPKQVRITQDIIENRLINHFQYHIGEADRTTKEELFEASIGVSSNMLDSYARFYWFEIIQKAIRKLRRTNKCFILKKGKYYFVLQSFEEGNYYKGLCDSSIEKMEKAKDRADDWVETEKWRTMDIPELDVVPEEVIEEKIEKPNILEDYKDKLKTKVIKLWENKNGKEVSK